MPLGPRGIRHSNNPHSRNRPIRARRAANLRARARKIDEVSVGLLMMPDSHGGVTGQGNRLFESQDTVWSSKRINSVAVAVRSEHSTHSGLVGPVPC